MKIIQYKGLGKIFKKKGFGDWTEGMAALSLGDTEKTTKNILIGSILTVIGMSILGMVFKK